MCPSKLNPTGHRGETAASTVISKWQVASERSFPDTSGILVFPEKKENVNKVRVAACNIHESLLLTTLRPESQTTTKWAQQQDISQS